MLGKRFLFATIAIICVSTVTILKGYGGDAYIKLVGLVVGVFTISQTITDVKKLNGGK